MKLLEIYLLLKDQCAISRRITRVPINNVIRAHPARIAMSLPKNAEE
jgi:hypothetical protein